MAASFRDSTSPNWNRFSGIFRVLSTSSTNSDTSPQLNPTRNSRINAIKPNTGSFCDGSDSEADLLSIDSSLAESDENVRIKKETNVRIGFAGFHQPVIGHSDLNIMDGGCKSFFGDTSRKRCMMIDATGMRLGREGPPRPSYWKLARSPDSTFTLTKVAQLMGASWLELSLRIEASLLSHNTAYTSYLVFKLESNSYGFEHTPIETSVGLSAGEKSTKTIFLAPLHGEFRDPQIVHRAPSEVSSSNNGTKGQYPKRRADGWLESELGECFVALGGRDDEIVEVRMNEIKGGQWKRGLVIQGIEFRPKA